MDTTRFSFRRFTTLLSRALEAATIVALIVRTLLFVVWLRSGGTSPVRTVLDDATTFLLLAILVLLLVDVSRLFTDGRCAVFPTVRAVIYLLLFCLSPYPLRDQQRHAGPNQAMELTATRLESTRKIATILFVPSTRALVHRRSSSSR